MRNLLIILLLLFSSTLFAQVDQQNGSAFKQTDLQNRIGMRDGYQIKVAGKNAIGDGGGGTWRWAASSTATAVTDKIIQPTGATTGRWILVTQKQESVTGLTDSLAANDLDNTLRKGGTLTDNRTIDATDFSFGVIADTTNFSGKGLNSRIGVISSPGSISAATAISLGVPVFRDVYNYPLTAVPFITKARANPSLEVAAVLNSVKLDSTRGYLDSVTELPAYIAAMNEMLDSIGDINAQTYWLDNEFWNAGYRFSDTVSTIKLYAATARAMCTLLHSYYKKVADGGFTGDAMRWMPWYDLKFVQGRTADANEYANIVFTSAERAGLANWATTPGSRRNSIVAYRQMIALYKTIGFDYCNLHWVEPTNGVDSAHINPKGLQYAVQYYSRVCGVPVLSNEIASKSITPALTQELVQAGIDLHMAYVILYDGTGVTTNTDGSGLDVSLRNTDNTLNTIGLGVKSQYTALAAAARNIIRFYGGKINIPGLATPDTTQVLGVDSVGNVFTKRVTGGTGGGGSVMGMKDSTKNGVTVHFVNPTTTPAPVVTLGAITPTSVVAPGILATDSYIRVIKRWTRLPIPLDSGHVVFGIDGQCRWVTNNFANHTRTWGAKIQEDQIAWTPYKDSTTFTDSSDVADSMRTMRSLIGTGGGVSTDTSSLSNRINARLDSTKKSITTTLAGLRALTNPQADVVYQIKDYGGGQWYYDDIDATTADNTGTIAVSTNGKRFKRIYDKARGINAEWFGCVGDSITDNWAAWIRARAFIGAAGGGIINFGRGTFTIDKTADPNASNGWLLEINNLTINGLDRDKTVLTTTTADRTGAVMSTFPREGGQWIGTDGADTTVLYPFKNITKKGDKYIILKSASWASAFAAWPYWFLRAGSHYNDQEFGEHITVEKVHNDTVFLTDALTSEYSISNVSYTGNTSANVTMPAVYSNVTINLDAGASMFTSGAIGDVISAGDNIFQIISLNTSTRAITMKNLGRGNSPAGTVLPAGTLVMKGRTLIKNTHNRYVTIQNLTLLSHSERGLRLDNTYHALIKNVKVIKDSATQNYCFTLDCTRDVKFENCEFQSIQYYTNQISRSSLDASFYRCKFINTGIDMSEFSGNTKIDWCDFHADNLGDAGYLIRRGRSTRSSYITNCTFSINGQPGDNFANDDDIQGLQVTQRKLSVFEGNKVQAKNMGLLFNMDGGGENRILHNEINGYFGSLANLPVNPLPGANRQNIYQSLNVISDNTVNASISNNIFGSGDNNIIENNSFTESNESSVQGANYGAVLTIGPYAKVKKFILRNNKFYGWHLNANPYPFNSLIDENVDISNNVYKAAVGTDMPDFNITLRSVNQRNFIPVERVPLLYNALLEAENYKTRVDEFGTITTTQYNAVKQALIDLYANNLRSKIIGFYPLAGSNASAAVIPALGQYLGGKNDFIQTHRKLTFGGGLDSTYYSQDTGFKGDGVTGFLNLIAQNDATAGNVGLALQMTKAGSNSANATYVGASSQYKIGLNGSGTLTGLGGATIKTSFAEEPSFILSSRIQASTIQFNYLDNNSNVNLSNTNFGSTSLAQGSDYTNRITAFMSDGSGNPSDVAIGALFILKPGTSFTLTEAKTLRTISRNLMIALGRPYQTASADAAMAGDSSYSILRKDGSTGFVNKNDVTDSTSRATLLTKQKNLHVTAVGVTGPATMPNDSTINVPQYSGASGAVIDDSNPNSYLSTFSARRIDSGYVPISRTINGKALSTNQTLTLASTDFAGQGAGSNMVLSSSNGTTNYPTWVKVGLSTMVTGVLPSANGGVGFTTYAKGDIFHASATNTLAKLPIGAQGEVLTVNSSGDVAWTTNAITPPGNAAAPDANYTIGSVTHAQTYVLPVATADRILTMPVTTSYIGYVIEVWNTNTSGTFHWNVAGGTIKDAAGTTITQLTNGTYYRLKSVNGFWIKTN